MVLRAVLLTILEYDFIPVLYFFCNYCDRQVQEIRGLLRFFFITLLLLKNIVTSPCRICRRSSCTSTILWPLSSGWLFCHFRCAHVFTNG